MSNRYTKQRNNRYRRKRQQEQFHLYRTGGYFSRSPAAFTTSADFRGALQRDVPTIQ